MFAAFMFGFRYISMVLHEKKISYSNQGWEVQVVIIIDVGIPSGHPTIDIPDEAQPQAHL